MQIAHLLNDLDLLPELRTSFDDFFREEVGVFGSYRRWSKIIHGLTAAFETDAAMLCWVQTFTNAWELMYIFTSKMDHLQDGDHDDNPAFAQLPTSIKWQLTFSIYAVAAATLDRLMDQGCPIHRLRRVRALWNSTMLRMASGQLRDLQFAEGLATNASLEQYQEMVQWKTGAAIALVFGGIAALCTDDQGVITTFTTIGETYGTLLQLLDDMADAHKQPDHPLTLHNLLATEDRAAVGRFWSVARTAYLQAIEMQIATLDERMQAAIRPIIGQFAEGLT